MAAPNRVSIVHGALVLFALALVVRAGKVQVVDGKRWTEVETADGVVSRGRFIPTLKRSSLMKSHRSGARTA